MDYSQRGQRRSCFHKKFGRRPDGSGPIEVRIFDQLSEGSKTFKCISATLSNGISPTTQKTLCSLHLSEASALSEGNLYRHHNRKHQSSRALAKWGSEDTYYSNSELIMDEFKKYTSYGSQDSRGSLVLDFTQTLRRKAGKLW